MAAFLDGLPSGPSGLLIEGEAGIGKTTVWMAGVADAAARSYLVLPARPTESEAKLSFAALDDLMDGVLERVLAELPAPQQDALQVALLLKDRRAARWSPELSVPPSSEWSAFWPLTALWLSRSMTFSGLTGRAR